MSLAFGSCIAEGMVSESRRQKEEPVGGRVGSQISQEKEMLQISMGPTEIPPKTVNYKVLNI